jgi:hypothetical protein
MAVYAIVITVALWLSARAIELEPELIQTHMTQKPMLRVEVGAVPRGRGQARRARRLVVCIRVCDSDSLEIMKKLL